MERGFDVTFPKIPLTGGEKSLSQLIQADDRSLGYGFDAETLQSPYLEIEKRLSNAIPAPLRDRIVVSRQLAVYGYFCYEFHAVSMFWSISCLEMALKLKFRELNPESIRLARKTENGCEETCEVAGWSLEQRLRERWRIPGMEDFDYSFRALLAWAFKSGILPENIPIPVQEIVNSFDNRFALEIFFDRARKDGLIGPNPSLGDIQRCWNGLTEKQHEHYRYKESEVLIEELPRFRNEMAHPGSWNFMTVPRSAVSAYELLIDMVSRLWPDPNKPAEENTIQSRETEMADHRDRIEIHPERITLYDSIHIPAGSQVPDRITFSFGADGGNVAGARLVDLRESQLIEHVLTNPLLAARLLGHLGIEYPNCWIVTEMLTTSASGSWKHPLPGDLDIICGTMKNGRPVFDAVCCAQVKIRKVKTLDDTGRFASGAGTEQSHWTAKMGFDRTLLLHCIVRVPQPLPEGYASSWNSVINADFERAAKSCYGTIRQRFESDRELYGFGWIGWGQAYGKPWDICGGFALDLVYPPPHRPVDSDDARKTRIEMIESFRSVISMEGNSGLPVIIQRKGR